jgi:surface antigen
MRQQPSFFLYAASVTVAFAAAAAIALIPDLASAGETPIPGTELTPPIPAPIPFFEAAPETHSGPAACACPADHAEPRSRFAGMPPVAQRTVLDESDEIAALESVQFALSEVGDGASYIWHRNNGRLSGMVQPVTSFKDRGGQVCRHVVVMLTSGVVSKKTEGVACRLANGQWRLEG